jgi:hypothetical protein
LRLQRLPESREYPVKRPRRSLGTIVFPRQRHPGLHSRQQPSWLPHRHQPIREHTICHLSAAVPWPARWPLASGVSVGIWSYDISVVHTSSTTSLIDFPARLPGPVPSLPPFPINLCFATRFSAASRALMRPICKGVPWDPPRLLPSDRKPSPASVEAVDSQSACDLARSEREGLTGITRPFQLIPFLLQFTQ